MESDLKQRATHFEFGANWLSFVDQVSDARVNEGVRCMERLFPNGELQGKRFLDIGCGSGLSMLAALELGAKEVIGVDIDENSIEASKRTLGRFAPNRAWRVFHASVFDLDPERHGRYDVVHSWGVLHHTGDLWLAVNKASSLVQDNGLLALALYRKTAYCGFWRREKYFYSRAPAWVQAPLRWLYQIAVLTRKLTLKQNPISHIREYHKQRGMSWTHDVHDWLGGYPYESSTPEETHAELERLDFQIVREWISNARILGLLGPGCNEYVAKMIPPSNGVDSSESEAKNVEHGRSFDPKATR